MGSFGESGMSVNRMDEVFHSSFQSKGSHRFCDHFCNRISDHVHTENLTVLLVRYDLHKSIARILDLRLGDGGEAG